MGDNTRSGNESRPNVDPDRLRSGCRYDLSSLDAYLLAPERAAAFLDVAVGELVEVGWLRRYDIAGFVRYRASEVVAARFAMTTNNLAGQPTVINLG